MNLRYAPLFLSLGGVLYATMHNPHFFWWFVGIGIIFIVLGYGLQQRARWMWYLGWVVMFLLSGITGAIFVGGMVKAQTAAEIIHGLIYLGVGLAIWVPVAVWWSTHRSSFGTPRRGSTPPAAPEGGGGSKN